MYYKYETFVLVFHFDLPYLKSGEKNADGISSSGEESDDDDGDDVSDEDACSDVDYVKTEGPEAGENPGPSAVEVISGNFNFINAQS